MKDITAEMLQFRDCAVETWNGFFASKAIEDQVEYWDKACVELFRALVLWPIERDFETVFPSYKAQAQKPLMFLHVEPAGNPEILINERKGEAYGVWGWNRPTYVSAGDADLRFRWYFDWNQHDKRSFEYVLTYIVSSNKIQDAEDRYALIESTKVRFLFDEAWAWKPELDS